ncbi:hypothetical protein [Halalkalibacter sp. APA_J-10(15)]|uniref:hypothetical protein n=1 Tax=Halalkalibacter sp. APA_J-10(15) TaxID=2933805 RepID=UPI001FF4B739|nr:hypothetical protein [Halalkalibacter sp. APA_J-10(15)]MCK0472162.1 hypothetical protein [Halalkalibacter sp. APA_J-10(15)]
MTVETELLRWLNEQTDIHSHNVVFLDGFLFMLKKIRKHGHIRMKNKQKIHPRFWRSYDRAFNFNLINSRSKKELAHLYKFYFHVAYHEQFVIVRYHTIQLSDKGNDFLQRNRDEQLGLLFSYIW